MFEGEARSRSAVHLRFRRAALRVREYGRNDSEYIRDLIRRDQARQSEVDVIRSALIRGEESGEPQTFNGDRSKERMAAKHARMFR